MYLDFSDDHLMSQHPDNIETEYSNALHTYNGNANDIAGAVTALLVD